ncbi:alpha/beta hydrolase [Kineococcus sp. SYSU DK001]|uniref:alpha/beta hydrolase n=1 Tax=Kineococcus sp. SYSU DK001 TaxID=3383122 RepID=UPI003D7E766C
MGLSSPVTQWVAAGVAVAALIAVVVFWRALARPGALGVLARSGALVGVNVSVLLAVFTAVNSRFGLFTDWADLVGSTGAVTVTTTSATGTGVDAGTTPPQPVEGYGGRVLRARVSGSGVSGDVLVVLPTGYGRTPAPAGGYPVLEGLHGWPGTPGQWLDAMGLLPTLDAAVAAGHLAPSLVVLPDLQQPAGRDTECVDGSAGQPRVETWLSQDVPAWLRSHYPVAAAASSWATVGLSMGGWCANALAMLHPDRFGAAISFGGYARLDLGAWKPFAPTSPQGRRYDLVALARTAPPDVKLWAVSSRTDELSWPTTSALAAAAHGPLSMTLLAQSSGGHRTSVWAGFLPQALTWLGTARPGFAPAPR